MTDHKTPTGLPLQPSRLGGSAAGGGGLADNAVQFIAYDPAGGDVERAWRIKDLNDYLGGGGGGDSPLLAIAELSFDTPGITEGILGMTIPAYAYVPPNGTALIMRTIFNGSTPTLSWGFTQADSTNLGSPFTTINAHLADTDNGDGSLTVRARNQFQNLYGAPDDLEIWIGLDDGSGADPVSTQGHAYFVVTYWPTA